MRDVRMTRACKISRKIHKGKVSMPTTLDRQQAFEVAGAYVDAFMEGINWPYSAKMYDQYRKEA